MEMPIKLISTDFDGTLMAEFENPPVPPALQSLIGQLQARGAKWVINTGRDLSSLMETLGRARLAIKPDFLVVVEREIYHHHDSEYVEDRPWNRACHEAHAALFRRVRQDVPRLRAWVEARFAATIYEDAYSPFCLIAERNQDADLIHEYLTRYCREVPKLNVMCNDIYARFCHEAYNKGTALAEIAGQLRFTAAETFAAGDHLNDLPMLSRQYAHFLAAPSNAIDIVKATVRQQNGHVSQLPNGHGVAEGLQSFLDGASRGAE
jgi:HAD superfamily hydrolase (TIGR01484 family)